MMSISVAEGGKDGADGKDEEADLLADFNELIADKFDDEDLEDINSIIMNPEILDDKITEDEPIKDVDDSSQATSTDDYDKLKIKQLVEDFAGVPEVDQSPATNEEATEIAPPSVSDSDVIQVPSEPENSSPPSVEMVGATESNDSKIESPVEDKVMIISDESSNTNDDKKEQLSDKPDAEGEESQSVKSSVDETKDAAGEDLKETRAFKGIRESDDNSAGSEKVAKPQAEVFQVDDSDEDGLFEDAKEHHDDSAKTEKESEADLKAPEKEETKGPKEPEDVTRSAGSVDSDDEVLEVKVSRGTGRKKALENLKTDAPERTTRSRDHSENDEKTPSRTRSRNSSTFNEPKYNFTKEQDHSMWKGRWEDCQKEIHKHKDYSNVIDNKTFHKDSYKSVVLRPMTMKIIQKNIESHVSTMPGDVKRDFALMCTNLVMHEEPDSKFRDTVHQFMKDGMEIIDTNLEVEDCYKNYRKQIKKKN